jgi:hypothetical protein
MKTIQLSQNPAKQFVVHTSTEAKMFVHNNPKDAERAVNQWLNENDMTIHHIAQSQSEKGGHFIFVITLFYMPND